MYGRAYLYYTPTNIIRKRKTKTKTRTAASRIAKMLSPGNRPRRATNHAATNSNSNVSERLLLNPMFFFFFSNFWIWNVTEQEKTEIERV